MNGFSAADMSTAAANGHRDGYQAGDADAVKAYELGAAQEAVKDRLLVALERAVWAETALRELADECENANATGWEDRMQSCLEHARQVLKAAPVAAAPAVDVATLRALADRWATDRSYTGSPVDDIRALIEKPTMSTPAAPGIDLSEVVYKLALDFGFTCEQADAWLDEHSKLLDASPKGGSTDAKDAARYRWLRDSSGNAASDTPSTIVMADEGGWDFVFGPDLDKATDAAMQATSAEVGE